MLCPNRPVTEDAPGLALSASAELDVGWRPLSASPWPAPLVFFTATPLTHTTTPRHLAVKMKFTALVLALTFGSAAAFAPVAPAKASVKVAAAKDDLIALAEANTDALSPGFWDPLGVAEIDFWGLGQDGESGADGL